MAMAGRILAVAVVLISVITPAPVLADEFRVIDPMGKEDTSRCIGDPRTPLCAIETFAACIYRGDESLCDRVGYDYRAVYGNKVPSAYAKLFYFRFKELDRRILRAEDIPERFREGPKRMFPGDLVVRTLWQDCKPNDSCVDATMDHPTRPYGDGCRNFDLCRPFPTPVTEILRKENGRWVFNRIYGDDGLPADFWKRK